MVGVEFFLHFDPGVTRTPNIASIGSLLPPAAGEIRATAVCQRDQYHQKEDSFHDAFARCAVSSTIAICPVCNISPMAR